MSLELIGDPSNRNLSRREADIAIRLARPLKGVAITRKLADMGFAVYGRRDQRTEDDGTAANSEPWATYDDSMAHLPEAAWVAKRMDDGRATIRTNDDTVLDGIVRRGLGIGLIACYLGDRDPALRRLSGPGPVVSREIWLLVHPDLQRTAQVRRTVDWLVDTVTADRDLLAGVQDGA
jgi:DNA-binding transcriptional LysR family regulator